MIAELTEMTAYIMPRHARLFKDRNLVACIVINTLEIRKACIIVVLARKECLVELCWMRIGKRTAMCEQGRENWGVIPDFTHCEEVSHRPKHMSRPPMHAFKLSTTTSCISHNKVSITAFVAHGTLAYLFMMAPEFHCVLGANVIGMAPEGKELKNSEGKFIRQELTLRQYSHGVLQGRAVQHCQNETTMRAIRFHKYLGVLRAHCHCLCDFFIYDNIYFYALLCFSLEETINSPFWIISRWATQIQFWG